MLKPKLKFDDLNLQFGQTIQIQPNPVQSKDRFECLLVGCIPNEAIIITASGATKFPPLEPGQPVAIRVMGNNDIAIFPTMVLHIAEIPIFLVYLDFPRAIQFKTVRNTSRIDVTLPVKVKNLDREFIDEVEGQVMDISVGGAKLELNHDVASKGENIEIQGEFKVGSISRTLVVQATVRAKTTGNNLDYEYGVEFHENDEEKLLILFGYIFNEMAFGKIKKIQ